MTPKEEEKLARFRECKARGVGPIPNVNAMPAILTWDETLDAVDFIVENVKTGRFHAWITKYRSHSSDYLDAIEELFPRLKEVRGRWN